MNMGRHGKEREALTSSSVLQLRCLLATLQTALGALQTVLGPLEPEPSSGGDSDRRGSASVPKEANANTNPNN